MRFSFEPADIVNEVMSFGSPTPVEVAVNGPNFAETRAYAAKLAAELAKVPSLRDLQFVQSLDYPTVERGGRPREGRAERRDAPRTWPARWSRPPRPAASSCPNYWADPKTGIGYQVQVEIPYQVMDSIERGRDDPDPAARAATASSCSATWPRSARERCPAKTTATT